MFLREFGDDRFFSTCDRTFTTAEAVRTKPAGIRLGGAAMYVSPAPPAVVESDASAFREIVTHFPNLNNDVLLILCWGSFVPISVSQSFWNATSWSYGGAYPGVMAAGWEWSGTMRRLMMIIFLANLQ